MKRLIVNADDFGMNDEINCAIIEAFRNRLISSTTIMANMPGFEGACELVHRHHLAGRIGVHLNITAGQPLSPDIRCCSRLCDQDGFRPRQRLFRLSQQEFRAVEAEFAAQVQACLQRGILPTHLDSHHHVHTEWAVGTAAIKVARLCHIPAIRLSRNCGGNISVSRRLYKWAYNMRLRVHGLARTQYFGSAADVQTVLCSYGSFEVMVHLDGNHGRAIANDCLQKILAARTQGYQFESYA